ncbi:hypothetical protein BT96DRAFT_620794 [Gymnopus androsaceus JB14]|uniref:DUF6697 domain-containing protein n=1 Tax=Gymnopus androsaceus JB14 TaxID=1447944 RepID=A0A6A4HT86_9AGAR|nr:hypothetical protein BT96DRAFT_620794 [Gymnopus androsaceus JB14]
MELDAVTIRKRIDKIGCPAINVTLPKDVWSQTVSRQFLSITYGGSPQDVFPTISPANVARHKRENSMLFSLLLHPDAPQIPGTPGVWYDSCGFSEEDQSDKVYHCFCSN